MSGSDRVVAPISGAVEDIDLRRFRRVLDRTEGRARLVVGLYDVVAAGQPLLILPEGLDARTKRLASKVVDVRRFRRQEMPVRRYVTDLADEALEAIQTGSSALYSEIADAYVQTLMDFPRLWGVYKERYSETVARGLDRFPITPVDDIRQQMYRQIEAAVRREDPELVIAAAFLPIRVAQNALAADAEGLITQMLGLFPAMYALGAGRPTPAGDLLKGRSSRHLVEFVRFYLQPRLERGGLDERLRAGLYTKRVFETFEALLRHAVERGDTDYVVAVDGDWETLLEHWAPELDTGGMATHARHTPTRMQEVAEDLRRRRHLARFALAMWAWRPHPAGPVPHWEPLLRYFARYFDSLPTLVDVTTASLEAEENDQVPWSDWILGQLQEGRAHFIGVPEAILDTFVILACLQIPAGSTVELAPREWFAWREAYLLEAAERLKSDARSKFVGDIEERVERLKAAITAAARAQRHIDEEAIATRPLRSELVDSFVAQARAALQEERVLPSLLQWAGAAREGERDPSLLIESYTHRALFVEGGRMVGADFVARDLGRSVSALEVDRLLATATRATVETLRAPSDGRGLDEETAATFSESLRARLTDLEGNYVHPILVIPVSWRLSEALGLPFLGGSIEAPASWGLNPGASREFVGYFGSWPVFQLPATPDRVCYAVDLARYAVATIWPVPDDEEVVVVSVDAAEAERRAARTARDADESLADVARQWRGQVRVLVDPGLSLNAERNAEALVAIQLPPLLSRD
jgi:hypothetical protein